MYESLGKAATAAGVSKSTILRASGTAPDQGAMDVLEAQIAELREAADLLRRQIDDVRADRDRERNRIRGLRRAS
jgi:hypothetical protein